MILWARDGWFTSPPWFLGGSRRNLAWTIFMGQRSVSRKQNSKIPISCHGNLEMRALRPCLTMKDWNFATKCLEKWNVIGPQIFWLSQNFKFFSSLHGNIKMFVLTCGNMKAVVHIMEVLSNQRLHIWFDKIYLICTVSDHFPCSKLL